MDKGCIDRPDLQLVFHLVVGKTGIHLDGLGDHCRTGHGYGDVPEAGFGLDQHARKGLTHAFELGDIFLDHRAGGQRLDRIGLDPVAITLAASSRSFTDVELMSIPNSVLAFLLKSPSTTNSL